MEKQPVKTIVVKSDGPYVSHLERPIDPNIGIICSDREAQEMIDFDKLMAIFTSSLIKVENEEVIITGQWHSRGWIFKPNEGAYPAPDGLVMSYKHTQPCIKLRKCAIADEDNKNNCSQLHGNQCQKSELVAVVSFLPDKEEEKEPVKDLAFYQDGVKAIEESIKTWNGPVPEMMHWIKEYASNKVKTLQEADSKKLTFCDKCGEMIYKGDASHVCITPKSELKEDVVLGNRHSRFPNPEETLSKVMKMTKRQFEIAEFKKNNPQFTYDPVNPDKYGANGLNFDIPTSFKEDVGEEKPDFEKLMIEVYKEYGLWNEATGGAAKAVRVELCKRAYELGAKLSPQEKPEKEDLRKKIRETLGRVYDRKFPTTRQEKDIEYATDILLEMFLSLPNPPKA